MNKLFSVTLVVLMLTACNGNNTGSNLNTTNTKEVVRPVTDSVTSINRLGVETATIRSNHISNTMNPR